MPKTSHNLRVQRLRGLAFVEIGGKRTYLGKAGSKEASIAYHKVMLDYLQEESGEPKAGVTIMELCDAYWAWAKTYYVKDDGSPTSQRHVIRSAIRRMLQQGETTFVADYGPRRFGELRDSLLEEKLNPRTVQKLMGVVRGIYKWGTEMELVPPEVFHGLQAVRGPRTRATDPKPIPIAHINAVRPHVKPQVWAMIQLQLLTSARPGEIVMLRPCDIDTHGEVWTAIVVDHKNEWRGDSRTLYIGPQAQVILRPWMLRPSEAHLFDPREIQPTGKKGRRPNQKPTPRKTDRRVGDHYSVDSYRRLINRACNAAGIPLWNPHQLRHTAATRIRAEFGVEGAQVSMGHKRADVTQVYAERNAALAWEIALRMG